MSIDKNVEGDLAKKKTEKFVLKTCEQGIFNSVLEKYLWQSHEYYGRASWVGKYCPTHQEIYERLKKGEV